MGDRFMEMLDNRFGGCESRRRVLGLIGGASFAVGGLSLLSACNDDVVGAESVPTPTPTATGAPPPAYTATDADRLNFTLQLHYLLAAYLQRSLDGTTILVSLTGGSGTQGQVAGGRAAALSDTGLIAMVREVNGATIARIGTLRRVLGNAVTAQPAINISGGQGSAFQLIAQYNAPNGTPPAVAYDPYASDKDFLLGAVALFAVTTSATARVAGMMGTDLRALIGALSAGVAANDSIVRNALFVLADLEPLTPPAGQKILFTRASEMSDGRDQFDGPSDLDQNIGGFSGKTDVYANIGVNDPNSVQVRRTPEQALAVLYTSTNAVSSGGFFPAGVNGTIRYSGVNI